MILLSFLFHRHYFMRHYSPLKDKCCTIVIDLGWESRLGDWKPNRKFPAGYRKIAAEIEAAGFVPGGMDLPSQGIDVWSGKTVKVSELTVLPAHGAVLLK
jgi:hypothetical protein